MVDPLEENLEGIPAKLAFFSGHRICGITLKGIILLSERW